MNENLLFARSMVLLVGLTFSGVEDLRNREVHSLPVLFMGVVGALLSFFGRRLERLDGGFAVLSGNACTFVCVGDRGVYRLRRCMGAVGIGVFSVSRRNCESLYGGSYSCRTGGSLFTSGKAERAKDTDSLCAVFTVRVYGFVTVTD